MNIFLILLQIPRSVPAATPVTCNSLEHSGSALFSPQGGNTSVLLDAKAVCIYILYMSLRETC